MTPTEEKIVNGIKHFVRNTENVGRTKLFKLLYFWDFIHFKKYGMSITNYDYYTYPFGPVPEELYKEINENKLPPFLKEHIKVIEDYDDDDINCYKAFKVLLTDNQIDYDCFSPNEKKILEEVTEIYKYATAKDMTEITHLPHTPWSKTKDISMFIPIDYHLAIDEESTLDMDEIEERFTLQKELFANGRH